MAENEILDMGGSRWLRTRAALLGLDLPLEVIANCIKEDLTSSLQSQLSKAFNQGQTLLLVLQAFHENPARLRAVVESFTGQALAHLCRNAIKLAPSKSPAHVATCAAGMLIDGCIDRACLHSSKYARFQSFDERNALRKELHLRLQSCSVQIAAMIEASLLGYGIRKPPRRSGIQRAPADASSLVSTSLVSRSPGAGHAPTRR